MPTSAIPKDVDGATIAKYIKKQLLQLHEFFVDDEYAFKFNLSTAVRKRFPFCDALCGVNFLNDTYMA